MDNLINNKVPLVELSRNLFLSLSGLVRILAKHPDLGEHIYFEYKGERHEIINYTALRDQIEKIDAIALYQIFKRINLPPPERVDGFNFALSWHRNQKISNQFIEITEYKTQADCLESVKINIKIQDLWVNVDTAEKLKLDPRTDGTSLRADAKNWRYETIRTKSLVIFRAASLIANIPPHLVIYDDYSNTCNNINDRAHHNPAYNDWVKAIKFQGFADSNILKLFEMMRIETFFSGIYKHDHYGNFVANKYKIFFEFLKAGVKLDKELVELIINQYKLEEKIDKSLSIEWPDLIEIFQTHISLPVPLSKAANQAKNPLPCKRIDGKANPCFIEYCTNLAREIYASKFEDGTHRPTKGAIANELHARLSPQSTDIPSASTLLRDYVDWSKVAKRFNKK